MSQNDASFEALRDALRSLWPVSEGSRVEMSLAPHILLLKLPSDVAAFSVSNGRPTEEFREAYEIFRTLYRQHNREWDTRTLSFVVCRSSERTEDDRFYATLEQDPLFCRKYVIRAHDDVSTQREELLRLPFLPLGSDGDTALERPPSAQDFLQSAGISASFARKLIESGHRAPERIADDLRHGNEPLPDKLSQPKASSLSGTSPRAHSRLVSMTVEGFRAYREEQTFDLDASVIVLYGPNGLGKTSFFDAIDYASTGRIGRYQKRSQSEFARLATHLDKTPGSGSVELQVRSTPLSSEGYLWKLQRGTGNWSTAWIDGQEVDRKTVMSKLTQANWLDAVPRQQNLESLFRATHLFGQDEQELLTEFPKNSVIPESFISEMLALQDYSQGLAKVTDVISFLSNYEDAVDKALSDSRTEIDALNASISELELADKKESELTPLEEAIASLHERLKTSASDDAFPFENPDASKFSEWHELTAARLKEVERRIESAQLLRDQLPDYARATNDSARVQQQLQALDKELQQLSTDQQQLVRRIEANAKAMGEAEARRMHLEDRRKVVRLAIETQAQAADLRKQLTVLESERDRQVLARSDADSRIANVEAALSKAIANHGEAERRLVSVRSEQSAIHKLLQEVPQAEQDRKSLVDLQTRLAEAQNNLQMAESREKEASLTVQQTATERETLQPGYERAHAEQADMDRLLDSIQSHVHGPDCPLCGSHFKTVEVLLEKIHRNRSNLFQDGDISVRYKTVLAEEGRAADSLRVAQTEVKTTRERIKEITGLRQAAERRLAGFQKQVAATIKDPGADLLRQTLTTRWQQLEEQRVVHEQSVAATLSERQTVQKTQEEEKNKRRIIQERITALARELQTLSDRIIELDSRVSQAIPAYTDPTNTASKEIEELDHVIEEILSSVEALKLTGNDEGINRDTTTAQTRTVSEKRQKAVAELGQLNATVSAFRQRLQSIGVRADADADELNRAVKREELRVQDIRGFLDMGHTILNALQAREVRVRLLEKQEQLESLTVNLASKELEHRNIQRGLTICSSVERLLKRERQDAIKGHVAAYGPMITKIQQRLRSVYGFGGVDLEPRDGQAIVHVAWRGNKGEQVRPADFFSDSQKQILMLSIFLAAGVRQNWSGFAPVLLDDPVTHFDDLNAYGFVELVRGIISTSPNEWQFIISTCEDRLFRLMQTKFSRLPSRAIFYEFRGITDKGPIIEQSSSR